MSKINPTKKPTIKKVSSKSSGTKKTTVKSTKAKKTVVKETNVKIDPAKKTVAKKKVSNNKKTIVNNKTAVIAKVDVGFGNELFIRGESGGLSWEKGLPMNCKANDEWHWESSSIKKPTPFKLLINDSEWSVGENETVVPSATCSTTPSF